MNKLVILCGMVFLGITSTPQTSESDKLQSQPELTPVALKAELKPSKTTYFNSISGDCEVYAASADLDVASIAYEVVEEPIDLGFDTREYLPENFDPHQIYVNLKAIPYLNMETEDLGVETATYLPEGFDPYAVPADVMDISYMEPVDMELGFDTGDWLPEGFNAYDRELDLNSIVYLEEEDLELGFDTNTYLPVNFDPYSL